MAAAAAKANAAKLAAAGHLGAWATSVEHGEFTMATKTGSELVDVQNGTVQPGPSATSITVKSADGFTATYALGAASIVSEVGTGGKPTLAPTSSIKAGDHVAVVAVKGGSLELVTDFGTAKHAN